MTKKIVHNDKFKRETWYSFLEQEKQKKKPERLCDLPPHLQGLPNNRYGGHQNQRMRPLKGSTFGAASAGRSFDPSEISAVEDDLRRRDLLKPSPPERRR